MEAGERIHAQGCDPGRQPILPQARRRSGRPAFPQTVSHCPVCRGGPTRLCEAEAATCLANTGAEGFLRTVPQDGAGGHPYLRARTHHSSADPGKHGAFTGQ